MNNTKRSQRAISLLLVSGMLLSVPDVSSKAAVITSNATDKTAVAFDEHTAYSAGDYVTHDEELYICTGDTQGAWSSAEEDFMQITKNHELGKSEELSVSYDAAADPAEEKSLMAFAANVWQKLKAYLGTEDRAAKTEADNYENASASAKLNFLKKQNEDLNGGLEELQESVARSFRFVSDGKSLLADTITGNGVQVRPDAAFQQFNDAIMKLAQLQFDKGHADGIKDADSRVNKDSESYKAGVTDADGRVNKDSESYRAGMTDADGRVNKDSESYRTGMTDADGRVNKESESYKAGASEADKRVNTESESYKQGLKDSECKMFSLKTRLDYYGPDEQQELFTYEADTYGREWIFQKTFEGHTIVGAYVTVFSSTGYGIHSGSEVAANINGEYKVLSNNGGNHSNGGTISMTEDTFTWDGFGFNATYADTAYVQIEIKIMYM